MTSSTAKRIVLGAGLVGTAWYVLGGGREVLAEFSALTPEDLNTEDTISTDGFPWYANLALTVGADLGLRQLTKAVKKGYRKVVDAKPPARPTPGAGTKAAGTVDVAADATKAAASKADDAVDAAKAATAAGTSADDAAKAAGTSADDVVKTAEDATKAGTVSDDAAKAATKADDAVDAAKAASSASDDVAQAGAKALSAGTDAVVDGSKAMAKAAKASKASSFLTKLKGTPADLIVAVIAVILQEVLDLDPEAFKPCSGNAYDLSSLPPEASIAISFIPFLGDLFSLLQPVLCFRVGCKPGLQEEAGLCYEPCREGYSSDGAMICYKNYPEFENNGMLHTLTSITKSTPLDTGKIPTECGPDEEQQGLLCYPKCPAGWKGTLNRCYKECPPGTVETLGRCEKHSYGRGVGSFPDITDEGYYNTSWGSVGCTDGRPFRVSGYDDCYSTWIVSLKSHCPAGQELDGGLCYDLCRPGYFGVGPVCWSHSDAQNMESFSRGDGSGFRCAAGQEKIAGLCYGQVPPGYTRKLLGTLDQTCPDGTWDFGVGCMRESYTRSAGLIPLEIAVKDRVEGFSY